MYDKGWSPLRNRQHFPGWPQSSEEPATSTARHGATNTRPLRSCVSTLSCHVDSPDWLLAKGWGKDGTWGGKPRVTHPAGTPPALCHPGGWDHPHHGWSPFLYWALPVDPVDGAQLPPREQFTHLVNEDVGLREAQPPAVCHC